MNEHIPEPTVIKRHCHGWLAVTPETVNIAIGEIGNTREEAVDKWKRSYAKWKEIPYPETNEHYYGA